MIFAKLHPQFLAAVTFRRSSIIFWDRNDPKQKRAMMRLKLFSRQSRKASNKIFQKSDDELTSLLDVKNALQKERERTTLRKGHVAYS